MPDWRQPGLEDAWAVVPGVWEQVRMAQRLMAATRESLVEQVARALHVSRATLYRALRLRDDPVI